jgi:hypothetical protein
MHDPPKHMIGLLQVFSAARTAVTVKRKPIMDVGVALNEGLTFAMGMSDEKTKGEIQTNRR